VKVRQSVKINKKLHFIWVGDESICPNNCIQTWRDKHLEWEVKVWGNEELKNREWKNKFHIDAFMRTGQFCGAADLMRWEILLDEGGVAIDADSICISSIPNWLLDCEVFSCWENELSRPGLVSNGFVGARAGNDLIDYLVNSILVTKNVTDRFVWYKLKRKKQYAWKTTGPLAFTKAIKKKNYSNITILPSHFSIPNHYLGNCYTGRGLVICSQLYNSTKGSNYNQLHKESADTLINRQKYTNISEAFEQKEE